MGVPEVEIPAGNCLTN